MKTNLKLFATSLVVVASSAQAELAWVQTPYWQAPFENQQTIKIYGIDPGLEKICEDYHKTVVSSPGKTSLSARGIEILRSIPSSMNENEFSARFRINEVASKKAADQSIEKANSAVETKRESDVLPNFTLQTAVLYPQLSPVSEIAPVANDETAMISISRSLGLRTLPVSISGEAYRAILKISGKDLACDLLAGTAHLEFDSKAIVRISSKDQEQTDSVYVKIENLVETVFNRKKSPIGRAALLGYKAAELLAPLRLSDEKNEAIVETVVDKLFDQNMERNQLWSKDSYGYHLDVSGAAQTNIKITAEK